MKKIIFSLLLLVNGAMVFAAKPEYVQMMSGVLLKMKDAKSIEALEACANNFSRVAAVEKEEWLPNYYTAMCYILETSMLKDGKEIDAKLDKADALITQARDISNSDELLCLESWSKSTRIGVDPMTRGMKYGMESAQLLNRATIVNQNNPRIYYLQAMSAYFTPEKYGGGKVKALELLKKAQGLFETFKPSSEIMPNWGKEQNQAMIETVTKEMNGSTDDTATPNNRAPRK